MRKLSLLAILPMAMLAQTSNLVANNAIVVHYGNYASNTETFVQATELATEIAQTAAQFAFRTINNTLDFKTLSREANLLKQLTKQLSALNKKSSPDLVLNLLTYSNKLIEETKKISNNSFDANVAANTAVMIAQNAAQIAQNIAYATPNQTLQTMALSANDSARFALNAFNSSAMISANSFNNSNRLAMNNFNRTDAIQEIVVNTIRSNPQLIVDTIASYSVNINLEKAAKLVKTNSKSIFSENNQLVFGNPKADITIVEFNDYNCTYCKQMTSILSEATKLDSNLRVIVKEVPIAMSSSNLAAKAAVAAKRQGQYENFRRLITATNTLTTPEFIQNIANTLGLDKAAFKADMNNPAIDQYLAKNIALAKRLGLDVTPAIIVSKNNGQYNQVLTGMVTIDQLRSVVANVRNKARF